MPRVELELELRMTERQEELQASLATLPTRSEAASNSAKRKASTPPSTWQPLVPLAQRFSFSNDTDKLQQIAAVQKSPVGAQIKRVLHLLLETRQSLLPEEINALCFVDVNHNKEVLENLKSNVKVSFDGQRFAHKAQHDVKNKEELLGVVIEHPDGVPVGDLEDSYPGILADLQDLKATGRVWVLTNVDSQEDIIYQNDPGLVLKVDEGVKQLIRGIETPREFVEVETELQKAGMKPATNSARRKAIAGVLQSS